ncbi:MAG: thioredoxin-disulfide reductase [Deinococcus sp.]|nr:thioredoxin-disulfide reductase [Deinococcus sp.]
MRYFDVLILGGGPAGLTAGLYAGRALLKTAVIERGVWGGQMATTEDIENYPGFPNGGVTGPGLSELMRQQTAEFGTELIIDEIEEVKAVDEGFAAKGYDDTYVGRALIIATGASPRQLGAKGEDDFRGRGVSYCATCDGPFYKDKEIVIVGGGDSAVDEALYMTRFAKAITIIHRRDELRAEKIMQERAFKEPKIKFLWSHVVEEIKGNGEVRAVQVRNLKTGQASDFPTQGVFVYVGMNPNTGLVQELVKLNAGGYVCTERDGSTSRAGVFAAGDVDNVRLRQVTNSVGMGAVAATSAIRYLEELDFARAEAVQRSK